MRRLVYTIFLSLVLATAVAHAAQAKPALGIADNSNTSFNDPRLAELKLKYARINIPWDVLSDNSSASLDSRANADLWMAKTKALGYQVLVSFDRSRNPAKTSKNPTNKQIVASLKAWQARWGASYIKTISAWNEPNINKKQKLVAGWYDALKGACKGCTVMPGELVDRSNLVSYAKKVDKYAKKKITLWGLHSYIDANNFTTKNITKFSKSIKKTIWLTETNGVVSRKSNKIKFRGSGVEFQTKATNYLLTKVAKVARLKRIYIYSWTAGASVGTFDSGLVVPDGTNARPALNIVRKYLGLPPDPQATSGI